MKILAATFSLFVAMALTSNAEAQEGSCCFVEEDSCELTSPHLSHTDRVFYTMKLHYKIPEPNKYALSVSLITNNSGVLLWESDTRDNSKTKELNITVCTTPQKITIQGQNFYPGKSGVDEEILIFHVSFHRLSTTEAITSTAQNVTSFCADTDTTTSDNWFSSRVNEDSMTTTSTLQSSDGLTTTATVVGVVVVALILLIITVVVFLRQKKKKYKKNVPASDVPPLDVNIAHPPEYPYLAGRQTCRENKISLDSTTGHDQGNYEYVQDPPYETLPGAAGGTCSSTLPADDVYNHTHDSVNKQLGRHGEGGGGIYSTLATEDTYSHLQGKEHHRFDGQGDGNKNPHLVTAPEDHYNHL
ncbi:hypothetical protein C0Q70_05084 [Pomacea canaliculata]|uniref:MAM domain-containing protein n=1 Tax=Pomacea canaliculata TaxID=400727 RepID=A0A2T7PK72_POMCA|nr:hypothetical protein C0Q70_05084 [Pomacea canaliculata]